MFLRLETLAEIEQRQKYEIKLRKFCFNQLKSLIKKFTCFAIHIQSKSLRWSLMMSLKSCFLGKSFIEVTHSIN